MRSKRKNRTDIKYVTRGGLFDIFDNILKQVYYINDDEYDYICEHGTDQELELLVTENPSFKEKREILNLLDDFLEKYNNDNNK